MNTKTKKFRQTIRINKDRLIAGGITQHAVRSWIYTDRIPTEESARRIAAILGISLKRIPHRTVI
jgi:hypothetical protein